MRVDPEPVTATPRRRIDRPIMLQEWRDLTYLHWRYPPATVQELLPKGFTVDTFDGSAWVGLLPFHMRRIRLPGLPPLGRFSSFPETNVRTYLFDAQGRRGVWFFSLDISRIAPALVARATYGLPYCFSEMSIEREQSTITYRSRRKWPAGPSRSQVAVAVGRPRSTADVTELDHFLTARWALGSAFLGRRLWAEVDHEPWRLHEAHVEMLDHNLLGAAGLPTPEGEPYALWSPGVEVAIGRPTSA